VNKAGDDIVADMATERIENLNKTFGIIDKTISPKEDKKLGRAATNSSNPNEFITLSKELSASGKEI
jgi:hypothetical protein